MSIKFIMWLCGLMDHQTSNLRIAGLSPVTIENHYSKTCTYIRIWMATVKKDRKILTSEIMRTGLVCLPRLKLSSTLPSMTATARKSPCNVGPWFIQMSKPLRVVVRMFTINLFRFSPRRLKYSNIIHIHTLEYLIKTKK